MPGTIQEVEAQFDAEERWRL